MGILINSNTHVIVQGLTGKEGTKAAIAMRDYGTNVVAGVTPGKGAQKVEGFPIYNTVAEAKESHPEANTAVLYVPASAVFDAALEAIEASLKLIVIITEHVPVQDASRLLAIAAYRNVQIIGPNSIGLIVPGTGKLGSIGGYDPSKAYTPGSIAVLSKSGGMCSEISHMLSAAGLGQSIVVGIGGDRIAGSTFADLLPLLEGDSQTRLTVVYGEIGGSYEEDAAEIIAARKYTKPIVACISGLFAETLPQGLNLGHAGAIVQKTTGTRATKVSALQAVGVHVVSNSDDIPTICKKLLTP